MEEIVKAVEASDSLHLYNIADDLSAEDNPVDKIVVINFKRNRSYGCCIDRGSKVTIVSTSGSTECCTGWFAYHIAKIGGFNYIGREVETDPTNPTTYYNLPVNYVCPNVPQFLEDLERLTSRPGSWAIPILASAGPRSRPHQFHFCYNTKKKDASYDDPNSLVKDYVTFDKLFNYLADTLKRDFNYNCDKNQYYAIGKLNVGYHTKAENVFTLRVESYVWMMDARYGAIIKALADGINAILEPEVEKQLPPEMVTRIEGHDFGMQDYVD
jgi:voltage-gated potassium channel